MIKLINRTNKADFRIQMENRGIIVNPTQADIKAHRAWSVIDGNGQQWKIFFTNNVGEFLIESITNGKNHHNPLMVYFKGANITIHKLIKNGRSYENERYLRKFTDIVILVNNLIVYGYIRL